jgi:hypothetical protein
MIRFVVLVPFQMNDPFSKNTLEHNLFTHRIKEPSSNNLNIQSPFISTYIRFNTVYLYLIEPKRRRLSTELLPIQCHIHIELKRLTLQFFHFRHHTSNLSILIIASHTYPILFLQLLILRMQSQRIDCSFLLESR